MSTIKRYKALTNSQKHFVKTGSASAEMSVHKWMRFLEPICKFDEVRDKLDGRITGFLILFVFLTFLSVFISAIVEHFWPILSCATIMILLIFIKKLFGKKNVSNIVRQSLYPLLTILSIEVGNKRKIALKMNLTSKQKKTNLVETPQSNKRTKFYKQESVELTTNLIDGTKIAWKVIGLMRRRVQTRGNKTKVKHKLKRRIIVELTFNKSQYSLLPEAKNLARAEGIFKEKENKILYKAQIKQSLPGGDGDIDMSEVLEATHRAYKYLDKRS